MKKDPKTGKLVAPDKSPVKMVDYKKSTLGHVDIDNSGLKQDTKLVRVKALCPIRVQRPHKETGKPADTVIQPGFTADITESEAREFCDEYFDGVANFKGERTADEATFHEIVRAVRIDKSGKQISAS